MRRSVFLNMVVNTGADASKPETVSISGRLHKWDVSRDLVPFVQIKKLEKYTLRSVTFSNVAGL